MEGIRDWYVSQSAAEAGERVVREILASLDQLAEFPESGRVVPEFEEPWLRELIRPPFRIVYRLEPERVRIVRVWRSERLMVALDPAAAAQAVEAAPTVFDSFAQSAARSTLERTKW
jgi:toxin ParE1/3/4